MRKSSLSCVVFTALLVSSCGGAPAEGEGEGERPSEGEGEVGEGEGEGEVGDDEQVAIDVVRIALTPGAITEQMLFVVVEMVGNATAVADSPTLLLTGTVVVSDAGNTYSPQPTNELVQRLNGVETHATISAFDVNETASTARDVFLDPHDVVVSAFRQGANVLTGESHLPGNGSGTRRGGGTLGSGQGFSFTGSLTISFDVDGSTAETTSETVNTGTLQGLGFDLEFVESSRYHAFVADSVVEDLQTGLSVVGTAGGATWNMSNALIKRTFRDGLAVEPDFWAGTTGSMTRNGVAFGTLRAQIAAPSILIVLDMVARDEILEEHQR